MYSPIIDRLRGILAAGVALGHLIDIAAASGISADAYWFLLQPWRQYLMFNCVVGFIVLSGYCIARSTISRDFSLPTYAWLRVTRIFPTLIACCLFAGAVELVLFGHPLRPAVWNAGFTEQAFVASMFGGAAYFGQFASFAPSYTVTFELLYYTLWGLTFVVFFRTPDVAIVTSLAIGLLLFWLGPTYMRWSLVLLPAWLIGAALAIHETKIVRLAKYVPPSLAWVLLFVAYTTAQQHAGVSIGWEIKHWIYYSGLGGAFAAVLATHLAQKPHEAALDRWLGEISYPLFLIHGPAMIMAATLIRTAGVQMDGGPFCLILMVVAVLCSQAVLMLVEQPIMAFRRRRRSTPVPAE